MNGLLGGGLSGLTPTLLNGTGGTGGGVAFAIPAALMGRTMEFGLLGGAGGTSGGAAGGGLLNPAAAMRRDDTLRAAEEAAAERVREYGDDELDTGLFDDLYGEPESGAANVLSRNTVEVTARMNINERVGVNVNVRAEAPLSDPFGGIFYVNCQEFLV